MNTAVPERQPNARLMRYVGLAMQAWGRARQHVAANPRLGIGLALLPVLVWAYVLVSLIDSVSAHERALAEARGRLARAETTAADRDWNVRKDQMEGLRSSLERRLWNEGSEGLVQAEFLEALGRLVRDAGLGRPQIRVERELTAPPAVGVRAISATLGADFTPDALNKFLVSLGSAEKLTVIRNLRIQRQPLARVDALLTSFFIPPGTALCKAAAAR